jgi:hypothetical protein
MKKLHNEESHSLYASPVIMSLVRSTRLRWVGTRVMRDIYQILVEDLKVRDYLDRRIMLKYHP